MPMLRKLCALPAVAILGIGIARTQSPTPRATAQSGTDALWAYAGTWKIEIDHLETPNSKASHETSNLQNDCWKSGIYVACRQIVDGDAKVLIVFTCVKPDHSCTSYQIPTDGGEPGSGRLIIEGNTWTFPWQTTDAGKTTYFRVVNVWSSPTAIDYRQEHSTDQVNWTKTAIGHEVKTSTK